MVKVQYLKKPLSFMKRIPDPYDDYMPDIMVDADKGNLEKFKIMLAKKDNQTAGWAVLYWHKGEDIKFSIPDFMIWVCPRFRKKGIGTRLFKEVTKFTKKVNVFPHDDRSIIYFDEMQSKFKQLTIQRTWN
jgi:GNAT superfamily N-acetyltransferase